MSYQIHNWTVIIKYIWKPYSCREHSLNLVPLWDLQKTSFISCPWFHGHRQSWINLHNQEGHWPAQLREKKPKVKFSNFHVSWSLPLIWVMSIKPLLIQSITNTIWLSTSNTQVPFERLASLVDCWGHIVSKYDVDLNALGLLHFPDQGKWIPHTIQPLS